MASGGLLYVVLALCALTFPLAVQGKRFKRSLGTPMFRDCGNNQKFMEFRDLSFSPNPVVVPGKLTLNMQAHNWRKLPNMDVKVEMKKEVKIGYWTFDVQIPCLADMGSCTYRDFCTRMIEMRDQEDELPVLKRLREGFEAGGAPSRCPISPRTLNVQNLELELPEIPPSLSPISGLADGTYKITYRLLDHKRKTELGCLWVQATLSTQVQEEEEDEEEECDGWLCW